MFPIFLRKDVRVETGLPLPSFSRDAQIFDAFADVLANHLPVEGGIVLAEIFRGFVAENLVGAVFLKLVKKCWQFSQVARIGELTNQVRCSNLLIGVEY